MMFRNLPLILLVLPVFIFVAHASGDEHYIDIKPKYIEAVTQCYAIEERMVEVSAMTTKKSLDLWGKYLNRIDPKQSSALLKKYGDAYPSSEFEIVETGGFKTENESFFEEASACKDAMNYNIWNNIDSSFKLKTKQEKLIFKALEKLTIAADKAPLVVEVDDVKLKALRSAGKPPAPIGSLDMSFSTLNVSDSIGYSLCLIEAKNVKKMAKAMKMDDWLTKSATNMGVEFWTGRLEEYSKSVRRSSMNVANEKFKRISPRALRAVCGPILEAGIAADAEKRRAKEAQAKSEISQ